MSVVAGGLHLEWIGGLCAAQTPPLSLREQVMTPLGTFAAGFQVISSWLMSMLAVLAVVVSVIICLVFVEFIFERAEIVQAYTVKTDSFENEVRREGNSN